VQDIIISCNKNVAGDVGISVLEKQGNTVTSRLGAHLDSNVAALLTASSYTGIKFSSSSQKELSMVVVDVYLSKNAMITYGPNYADKARIQTCTLEASRKNGGPIEMDLNCKGFEQACNSEVGKPCGERPFGGHLTGHIVCELTESK
jgi:hypothetical protein